MSARKHITAFGCVSACVFTGAVFGANYAPRLAAHPAETHGRLDQSTTCSLDSVDVCRDCVRFSPAVELGTNEDRGFLQEDGTIDDIVRDAAGNYWVGQTTSVHVYSPDGAFIRSVGRAGEGPLEFQYAQPAHADRSNGVHIFDPLNLRISVVGPDFALLDERPLPAPTMDMAPLDDGDSYVVQSWIPAAGKIGHPLHVVKGRNVLHSFGVPAHERTQGDALTPMSARRVVAVGSQEHVFSAGYWEYSVDVWERDGTFIKSIRGPTLNPQELIPGPYSFDNPPRNQVFALHADDLGQLWVLMYVRRPDWKDNVTEQLGPNGALSLHMNDGTARSMYFSRVDVIDVKSCRLVASAARPGFFNGFLKDGEMTELTWYQGYLPRIQVWQVRVHQPTP